jgi:hypothetical protein
MCFISAFRLKMDVYSSDFIMKQFRHDHAKIAKLIKKKALVKIGFLPLHFKRCKLRMLVKISDAPIVRFGPNNS